MRLSFWILGALAAGVYLWEWVRKVRELPRRRE